MNALIESIKAVVDLVPYYLLGLLLFFLGKFAFDLSTPSIEDDKELTERDNPAFGVLFSGYMVGLAFAIAGSFFALGPSVLGNIVNIATSGVAGIVLLRLGMIIGDKLILSTFQIEKEIIQGRNVATAFAVSGLFVATGLMIAGVMSGESRSFLLMLRDIAIYWLVGQAFLVVAGFIVQAISRYDVRKAIEEDGNIAAGLSMGGFFVGLGIILKGALTGTTSNLGPELIVTVVIAVVGLILLIFSRFLTDVILLPKAWFAAEVAQQKNVAAGAVSAIGFIAVGVLFNALVKTQFFLV
ncbi:MAG TPA: DUF350 domain-containing protein [Spirochaetia bacterium]|nr:DUF350 domain-containing protein [Spirochaetia bacterium]